MRDRLIELLRNAPKTDTVYGDIKLPKPVQTLQTIADHLIANGVIVLPYKPLPMVDEGEEVLCPICEKDLMGYYIGGEEYPEVITCFECGAWINSRKAVEREEAEKALAEKGESYGT